MERKVIMEIIKVDNTEIKKSNSTNEPAIKIGKLSLDGCDNYGNVLQSYALQMILEHHGSKVDCLWHMPGYMDHPVQAYTKWRWREWVNFIFNRHGFRQNVIDGHLGWEMTRMEMIYRFCQRYLHLRRVNENLENIADEYDCFVVGSDQVWNPEIKNIWREHLFLCFAPQKKSFAYSASIVEHIPKELEEEYRSRLKDFAYISMREEMGARIVSELLNREIPVLIDPTFLITAEEWMGLEKKPLWLNENRYVLTYFLGKHQFAADEVANVEEIPIINLLDKNIYEHYVTSPEEFIYLIHHADLVYTDSFHGTVFSILFKRPFVVCERIQSGKTVMTSRLDTLLKMCSINGRRGNNLNNYKIDRPFSMVYPDIDKVLRKERGRSYQYIEMMLDSIRKNNKCSHDRK